MGLIYTLTKGLPGRFQGLHPTTLDELLDKTERLQTQGVTLDHIDIVPRVVEGEDCEETMFGSIPTSVDYVLECVALYATGRKIAVTEPTTVWLPSYDSRNIAITEAKLMAYANTRASSIRECGYSVIVGDKVEGGYNNAAVAAIDNTALARAGRVRPDPRVN